MIKAVLFDVGGTLHVGASTPERDELFMTHLLERLAKAGIVLTVSPAELAPILRERAEEYKLWSEKTRRELQPSVIWSDCYLRDFGVSQDRLAPIAEELAVMYDEERVQNTPRPHLRETVQTLRRMGLRQGIISNITSVGFVPMVLRRYGIAEEMETVVMSSQTGIRKPDPAIFRIAAGNLGIDVGEMAYVGDTLSRDVLGCRNAGVGYSIQIENPSIAHRDTRFVDTGLAPDARIRGLDEIPALIREKNKCYA